MAPRKKKVPIEHGSKTLDTFFHTSNPNRSNELEVEIEFVPYTPPPIYRFEQLTTTVPPSWSPFFQDANIRCELHAIVETLQCDPPDPTVQRNTYCGTFLHPHPSALFHPFYLTPLNKVKVVILDSTLPDDDNSWIGLVQSFSKPPDPASCIDQGRLTLLTSLSLPPTEFDLRGWGRQGVLLLPMVMSWYTTMYTKYTKRQGHMAVWYGFISYLLNFLIQRIPNLLVVPWGEDGNARKLLNKIGVKKQQIIERADPYTLPPPTVKEGFKTINSLLGETHQIDWKKIGL